MINFPAWDTQWLVAINGCHSTFFDGFWFAYSDKLIWLPLYAVMIYIIIRKWKKEAWWIIPAFVLCIVLSDQISSGLIKHWVARLRPSQEPALQSVIHIVNEYRGGRFGFVSSHAANSFGFALLSSLLLRKKVYSFIIFTWALLTCYSRMYLGVHYPLDIVGGIVVGTGVASLIYALLRKFRPQIFENNTEPQLPVAYAVLSLTFLALIVVGLIR
jgi:undecaprenyl-diphosphatase